MDAVAVDSRMTKTMRSFRDELAKIRTGRAHTGLLDQVRVSCYGQEMQLPQAATVAVGGHRLLTVAPWDSNNLAPVEKGIRDADLGLNPSNDGNKILVHLPELSEDRRAELVKLVKREAEGARVAVRNIRRDEINALREQVKAKEIGESGQYRDEKQLQEIVDRSVKVIDELATAKAEELMQV